MRTRRAHRAQVAVLVLGLALTACSTRQEPGSTELPSSPPATSSVPRPSYPVDRPTLWQCRPGLPANPCAGDLDTLVVRPDGTKRVQRFTEPAQPAFDCFYVYPTVSQGKGRNAPLAVAPEIVRVVRAQAALFQRVCRLYAPVYRQVTLHGLVTGGLTDPDARALAQRGVVSAFHDYLNRFNDGRPFLLLGHSQGAMVLTDLVQTDIDPNPELRSRLVSAMLLGGAAYLSAGSTTQGSFQHVPPCRSTTQTGCVVAYNSYAEVPPRTALFGRTVDDRTVICVNPGAPGGGAARLDPVIPVPASADAPPGVGFIAYPDSVTASCRSTSRETWLDVRRASGSQLPDLSAAGSLDPNWGLHRVDVTLALDTLIELAASQAAQVS